MLDAGADLLVGLVVLLFPRREFALAALPSAIVTVVPTANLAPDYSHSLQSSRFPASGQPNTTTRRVSASMTT
jgi:hypothetical protein